MLSNSKNTAIGIAAISGTAGILSTIINIPIRVATMGLLGPINFGVLRVFSILESLVSYCELGSRFGLSRQVPRMLKSENVLEARSIAAVSLSWTIAVYLFSIIVLSILYALGYTFGGLLNRSGILLITVTLLISSLNRYATNYALGFGVFKAIGGKRVVSAISPLIMLIPVYFWETTGALVGLLVQNLLLLYVVYVFIKNAEMLSVAFSLNFTKLKELLLSTSSLFSYSTISHISVHVAAPLILVAFDGVSNLGLLTFAEEIRAFAQRTMNGAKVVVERKMYSEETSYSNSKKKQCDYRKYFGENFILYLLLNSILLGFAFISYNFITKLFIAEFVPGLNAGLILIFSNMIFAAAAIPISFLISIDLTKVINTLVVIWLILKLVLLSISLIFGYGLMGVVVAITISNCLYTISVINAAFHHAGYKIYEGVWFSTRLVILSSLLCSVLSYLMSLEPYMATESLLIHQKIYVTGIYVLPSVMLYVFISLLIYSIGFYDILSYSSIKRNISITYKYLKAWFVK